MKKIILLSALALFFSVSPALAADGLTLVTSPLPINLVADPGSTASAQLKVKNGGTSSETLQVGLMKFGAYGEDGKPQLLEREKTDSYFDWVKFSEDSFELAPNEWKTIDMNITVPKEAAFGYYYAVTFSRKNEEIPNGPKSTKIIGATATLVLLDVRVPNAVRDIEVLDFSTDRKTYEFLPADFIIKLKNKGNVHVAPRGNIFITQGNQKKEVAVLEINEVRGNILPSSNRSFETKWVDGFPFYQDKIEADKTVTDKDGKVVKELKWDFSKVQKLRYGKYTANMLLVYDDGKRDVPIEAHLTFWVMPWRLIGVGVVALLFMAAGAYLIFGILLPKILKRRK